jgi:hypothetical protein
LPPPIVRGVCHSDGDEERAEPTVAGAHVGRAKTAPFDIEPQRGQIPQYGAHSAHSVICGFIQVERFVSRAIGVAEDSADVLSEEERRSAFIEHAGDVRPDPSLVVDAAASAGDGVRLARPSRSDAIHDATQGSSIESQDIAEDLRRREVPSEAPRRLRVFFDASDAAISGECNLNGAIERADSGAEGEAIHAALLRLSGPYTLVHRGRLFGIIGIEKSLIFGLFR